MRWYRWHFYRVPLKCRSGPAVSRITVKGGLGMPNKYADSGSFGGGSASWKAKQRDYREFVSGRLVDPRKARGVLRVSGSDVPLRGGGSDKCDSGLLHWKARR